MPSASSPLSVAPDLQTDARRALLLVGQCLRGVIDVFVPGTATPKDLEKLLGLHKTLAWRLLQVAYGREPLAAATHLPGQEGIEKFTAAALKAGAARPLIDAVHASVARYRELMKSHAGDRASFDVMLQDLAATKESAVELRAARRAGYKAASYAWGVQTAVRSLTAIVNPTGADLVDLATIRAHVGARRIRQEGLLRMSRTVEHDTDQPGPRRAAAQAIEPEHLMGGVPLLPEFCTSPLPPVEAMKSPDGSIEYRFTDRRIGAQSAVTVYTGEVRRELPGARWKSEGNSANAIMMTIRDPVGLGVIDLWAPPGFGSGHRALVVSAVGVDPLLQRPTQWHELPATASVEAMGRGLRAVRLDEAPAHERAVAHCFRRLGWEIEEFELHRVRLDYPLLGSCLVLQTMLLERPSGENPPTSAG